jgi:hypothetical protein
MKNIGFGRDSTVRLSCRAGDYLIWCGLKNIFASRKNQYAINDVWQLSEGDFITITNRQVDLPPWFELHPLEVSGRLVYWMMKKLDAGYKPGEIIDGPNIWRAFEGDRLVWVGKKRQGVEFDNGVLGVYTFNESAAIIGEPISIQEEFPCFGGFDQEQQSEEDMMLCQNGWNAIMGLEAPRNVNIDGKWTIG